MKRNDLHELLIGYAEGTLDPRQKESVENILKVSAEAQQQYESLKLAFKELQKVENDEVPSFYFENFVPRLYEAIPQKKTKGFSLLPAWTYKAAAPFAVVMITISIVGLFNLLNPARQDNLTGLNLNEIDQNKLGEVTFFTDVVTVSQLSTSEMNRDLITDHIVPTNNLDENAITDRQILSQLDDTEIEDVVDRLKSVQ